MKKAGSSLWFAGLVVVLPAMLSASVWAQCETAKVAAADGAGGDRFGWATAIDGDDMVVGAYRAPSGGVSRAGRAYIYHHNGMEWEEAQELTLPSASVQREAEYGYSVVIDGDLAVIGTRCRDGGGVVETGAAVVWRRDVDTGEWVYEAELWPADSATFDKCGSAVGVGVSGGEEWVVVGCPGRDDTDMNAGAVAVFRFNRGMNRWEEDAILTASDGRYADGFGEEIAIDGDLIVVGVPSADPGAVGAGAVYAYRRDSGNNWIEMGKLVALNADGSSDAQSGARFGVSVSTRDGRIVCGADGYDTQERDEGAAYVFVLNEEDAWEIEGRFLASDPALSDWFGESVSIAGTQIGIGAYNVDYPGAADSGAVYLFDLVADEWVENSKMCIAEPEGLSYLGYSLSLDGGYLAAGAYRDNGYTGSVSVFATTPGEDCDGSGVHDDCEYFAGILVDDSGNGYSDVCDCTDGDADRDARVDLRDFAAYQACVGKAGVDGCRCVDMDDADGVDLTDFTYFEDAITGP